MNKKFIIIITVAIISLVTTELYLRYYWGFCDAVLMREDSDYEYIPQANQERLRFRKKSNYNSFSMRSEPVDSSAVIILGLGDSVINGGSQTDNDDIATTLLTKSISQKYNKKHQVLNIAGFSWGPDNCAAFLNKHGDFSAKIAFLIVSSHDAFDNMDFMKVVGKHKNFPSKQYPLALIELADRYIIPRFRKMSEEPTDRVIERGIVKGGNKFNEGFSSLSNFFKERDIPFFIYLHPEISEIEVGAFNGQGARITEFCKKNNIHLITSGINTLSELDYRDKIHLNEKGQFKMYKILSTEIDKMLIKNL